MPPAPFRPLVSVIMPVHNRVELTRIAIQSYLSQDYPSTEIVIVDTSYPLQEELMHLPNCTYIRRSSHMSIGAKRNLACGNARGEIIVHMDSDDLSSPVRIRRQVETLIKSGSPVTGYHTLPFYDILNGKAYRYHLSPLFCCGASLAYHKSFWELYPFPDTSVGEDLPYTAQSNEERMTEDGSQLMVALLHADNISSHRQVRQDPNRFREISTGLLPHWFREQMQEHFPVATPVQ